MASPRSLLDLGSREDRASVAVLVVLLVAFGVSFVTDPSPHLAWALGAGLVFLIVLRTLFAMGVRFGR